VREHGPLAPPRGAAGVEDDGDLVGVHARGLMLGIVQGGALDERSAAVLVQRKHASGAGLMRDLGDAVEGLAGTHDHRGFGVPQEIVDFGG